MEVGQDSCALRGPHEYVENILELAGISLMMILIRSFCPETTYTGPNFRLGVVNSSDLQNIRTKNEETPPICYLRPSLKKTFSPMGLFSPAMTRSLFRLEALWLEGAHRGCGNREIKNNSTGICLYLCVYIYV